MRKSSEKHNDVGTRLLGASMGVSCAPGVANQITDGGVELGKCNAHAAAGVLEKQPARPLSDGRTDARLMQLQAKPLSPFNARR